MKSLIELFSKGHGSASKQLQFKVLVLSIVIATVIGMYFNKTYAFVIILLFAVGYIADTYVAVETQSKTDVNKAIYMKLQTLQSLSDKYMTNQIAHLGQTGVSLSKKQVQDIYNTNKLDSMFLDANLIEFLYSIRNLAAYNMQNFYALLKTVNNVLRIRKENEVYFESNGVYPENVAEMFEIAIDMKSKAINHVHNFIYSAPKTSAISPYMNDITNRFHVLISRNLDVINAQYKFAMKQNGITTSTKFVTYNTTKPYENMTNHPVVPAKGSQGKLLDYFY
jgi:hypothetical protein